LSPQEAEALFLSGLPGPVQALGLGAVMAGAQTKLLAALPVELRSTAERMRSRFHLDAPAWFADADQPAHLPLIARAVWEQHPLRIRYQSWKAEKVRRIEPLGVVLKGGAWYVVGRVDADIRIYRISRILELTLIDETFERPPAFELAEYWRDSTQRLSAEMHASEATLRLSPWGMRMLEAFTSPFARSAATIGEPDPTDGWRTVTLPVGSLRQACAELLRFGAEAEVLAPPELRAQMCETVAALNRRYAT